ncbi:MAG: hypothetical protein IT236_09880 [Bacteroidia bacterium]|nr:hypothetical protein [Bacteroidia bacterium]
MKKNLILAILSAFIFSCNRATKNTVTTKDDFFYITVRHNRQADTSEYTPGFRASELTELLYEKVFSFKNKPHLLRLYLIDGPPIDDEGLAFVLDSIGMVYSKSLVWGGYSCLNTSNDSIREIIDEAKNQILADPNLHCYQCRRYDQSPELVFRKTDAR